MINFVSTSPNNLIKYGGGSPYIGYLGTPRTLHNIPDSMTFALDNDCFNDYNPDKIITMLKKYTSIANRCKFATVPDVVENAVKTTVLFDWWFHVYKRYGYTCAYVLQDGVTTNMIPYNRIGALFIGGSTEFKLSKYTAGIVKDAVDKGLWVHMGRVNSAARARNGSMVRSK